MNPIQLHQLALDRQAELLAEAARERLARPARDLDRDRGIGTIQRLRALVAFGRARVGRTGQAPLPPRSA